MAARWPFVIDARFQRWQACLAALYAIEA